MQFIISICTRPNTGQRDAFNGYEKTCSNFVMYSYFKAVHLQQLKGMKSCNKRCRYVKGVPFFSKTYAKRKPAFSVKNGE